MKRTGRKNRPSFRISATNSRNARDGRTLETLGHYDPASPVEALRLKVVPERILYWLGQGAKPSETVASILRQQGIRLPEKPVTVRDRSGAPRRPRRRPTAPRARRRWARPRPRVASSAGRAPRRRQGRRDPAGRGRLVLVRPRAEPVRSRA
jgi:small subunit ribosomal protein S16